MSADQPIEIAAVEAAAPEQVPDEPQVVKKVRKIRRTRVRKSKLADVVAAESDLGDDVVRHDSSPVASPKSSDEQPSSPQLTGKGAAKPKKPKRECGDEAAITLASWRRACREHEGVQRVVRAGSPDHAKVKELAAKIRAEMLAELKAKAVQK